jgi:hypothetical protein
MEFAIRLFISVAGAVCRRYLLPFILVTIVLTLGAGGIAALSGGAFMLGAKYALEACLGIGGLAAIVTAISAIKNGF